MFYALIATALRRGKMACPQALAQIAAAGELLWGSFGIGRVAVILAKAAQSIIAPRPKGRSY